MTTTNYILVTGGAGYIGTHTVVELFENGFTPVIADDFRNSHRSLIEGVERLVGRQVILREVDVSNHDQLKTIFAEFQFVGIIHFAAYKAVGESVENPIKYYQNNIECLLNCVELAIEFDVPNFVFSSSCTVYGDPIGTKTVTEDAPMQKASSPYGNTKQIGEQILDDIVASGANLKVLKLRYFNPVGAHPSGNIGELPIGRPNNLLPAVTQTGIGKIDMLTVNGNDYNTEDGTCRRDFIHVMDLANAHVKGLQWLAEKEHSLSENINVGTGEGVSVMEIIHTFEKVSGKTLNWSLGPRREGDIAEIFADVTKAKELLNWESAKTFEDAVIDAWNWEQLLSK